MRKRARDPPLRPPPRQLVVRLAVIRRLRAQARPRPAAQAATRTAQPSGPNRSGNQRRHAVPPLKLPPKLLGVRLVLMADTHVPKRARDLPAELWTAVDGADVVVHAGDWVDLSLLDVLQSRAKRLIGCYGNNDGPELRTRLPEI